MNYKNLFLAALLLPFSGYAITKDERRDQILNEIKSLEHHMQWVLDVMKYNFWAVYVSPGYFKQQVKDSSERGKELQKELDQIELELKQEQSCTNK